MLLGCKKLNSVVPQTGLEPTLSSALLGHTQGLIRTLFKGGKADQDCSIMLHPPSRSIIQTEMSHLLWWPLPREYSSAEAIPME